jgi:DNA-binding SARP family transcriptional activator/tetratricopeptide (TPR) repeat protein
MAWFVQLFGIPAQRFYGKTNHLPSNQTTWLTAVLVCSPNGITRTVLSHLFWADSNQTRAAANLRQALLKYKKTTLGTYLRLEADMVFLDVNSDYLGFWQAIQKNDSLTALELARDEFLANLETNTNELLVWREQQREQIHKAWQNAAIGQIDKNKNAAFLWEQILEKDGLAEELLQQALVWCEKEQKPNLGLRWYKRFALLLEHELQSQPSTKTVALVKVFENNIASQHFVGRRVELEKLALLATQNPRIAVSILGFGGTGKTTLALEALRHTKHTLVQLNDVIHSEILLSRMAQALGIRGVHLEEQIPAALEARGGHVLLDNAESLNPEARELLQTWVDSWNHLQWWITSREPILAHGEIILLQGLEIDTTGILHSAAGQHFLHCAKKANPDFTVTDEKLLLELCQMVRGSPLALEFIGAAASRHNLNALHKIFVQEKTWLPNSTIQPILETSFTALTTNLQKILSAVVILPNGTPFEFVQHFIQSNFSDLEQLFYRGWLEQSALENLKIHELVRQYLEKKRSKDTEQHLLSIIKEWFYQHLAEPQVINWTEIQNHWLILETTWNIAMRYRQWHFLEDCVWLYWRVIEQLEYYQIGLSLIAFNPTMSAKLQSALLTLRGWCETRLGRSIQAQKSIETALSLFEHRFTLEALAQAQHSTGDFILSLPIWNRALEAHVLAGDTLGEARVLLQLGDIASETGENQHAENLFFDALRLARRNQDAALTAKALHLLGALAVHHGQLELGRNRYQEAIIHLQPLGKTLSEAKLINNIAVIDHMNYNIESARDGYLKSLELRRPLGDKKGIAQITANLAMLEWDHGDRRESLHLHETALAERERLGDTRGMVNSHNCLCEVYLHFELFNAAQKSARQATLLAGQLGSEVLFYHCLISYTAIALFEQKLELATHYLAHPRHGKSSKECKFSAEMYELQLQALLPAETMKEITERSLEKSIYDLIKQCLEQDESTNVGPYSH